MGYNPKELLNVEDGKALVEELRRSSGTGGGTALATQSAAGLMSAADKANLDTGILAALREASGAGRFNAYYRGKRLGTTDSDTLAALSEAIADGSFEGIYCGDYLIGKVSGLTYDLAHADYRLGCGDQDGGLTTHHILAIPRENMGDQKMNDTSVTTGAYVGSKMYTDYLKTAIDTILADFGEDHVLEYRAYLQNAVTKGYASASAWYSRKVDLMNEVMVYGCYHYDSGSPDGSAAPQRATADNSQAALFRHRKDLINPARYLWWLRDVAASTLFTAVHGDGYSFSSSAGNLRGVRPSFLVY